jgi:hypothetical protein
VTCLAWSVCGSVRAGSAKQEQSVKSVTRESSYKTMFRYATRKDTQSPGAVKWKHVDRRGSPATYLVLPSYDYQASFCPYTLKRGRVFCSLQVLIKSGHCEASLGTRVSLRS